MKESTKRSIFASAVLLSAMIVPISKATADEVYNPNQWKHNQSQTFYPQGNRDRDRWQNNQSRYQQIGQRDYDQWKHNQSQTFYPQGNQDHDHWQNNQSRYQQIGQRDCNR
jgi:hypothetical protein